MRRGSGTSWIRLVWGLVTWALIPMETSKCGDSLLNMVMSPVGHEEQQGDDGSDGDIQGGRGARGPQAVLTRSRAKQC
jgi:hypothetical protein